MIARLRAMWARAPWLLSAFTLAVAVTLYFGVKMVMSAIYWNDPRHIDQALAGWMSPGYVAMSWNVPRDVMMDILDLEPNGGRPPRLADIAAEQGLSVEELGSRIEAAIRAYRADAP